MSNPISKNNKTQELLSYVNNFDNDRDQYKQDYENAYKSLTKVPELSERD